MNWKELNKLVINLPERPERLDQFNKECIYVPMSNLQVVSGIRASTPMLGIAQAHINCVMIAKQMEWPEVLIMEDDVLFPGKDQTYDYLLNCISSIPPDWNILLGGVYESKRLSDYNDYWNRTEEFCGCHFYIVNANCYDRILQYDGKHHIDRWINKDGKLNCYVAKKFFAIQRPGHSDNQGKVVDFQHKLKKFNILK